MIQNVFLGIGLAMTVVLFFILRATLRQIRDERASTIREPGTDDASHQ